MKIELKETIGCKKKLYVEVDQERFDAEIKNSVNKLRREVQIPGFRKGKAPDSLLLRRFGPSIQEEAVKGLIPKVLKEMYESEGLKPAGEPEISNLKIGEDSTVSFMVGVEELPAIDIEVFKGLAVTKEALEVTDDDVENTLERYRRMKAVQNEVDREVREGDIVVINLQKLDSSGLPIIGDKLTDQVVALDGQSSPSPDFDRQIAGMKKGDHRVVRFTYDESIDNPNLVGVTEVFDVEIVHIHENIVPELDDDFARSFGNYADLADLREKTRKYLAGQYEYNSERKLRESLMDEFIRQNPFEVPGSMVEKIIHSELKKLRESRPDEQIDEASYRAQVRPDAVRGVQSYLVLEVVKEKQQIEVTKEELAERLELIARLEGVNERELRRRYIKNGRIDEVRDEIALNKAYKWMESVADIRVETAQRTPQPSRIIKPR
ncbi:MAG: trigger factor [Candidatus Latescibacter sp.]|nr:trigger factor [Candidatus Latescibacter sp.]